MKSSKSNDSLTFNSSGSYRIRVKGYLDESWSELFINMSINNEVLDKTSPISTISGRVKDQTELIGLLNNIYEMHLPILSVEFLDTLDR